MASFSTAYDKYVKPIEGGYANKAGDKGGETYAGIARNFWPNWSGWAFVDKMKLKGTIKWNTKFPELDSAVRSFYQGLWDRNFFGKIDHQDIANILYDWFVNSGSNAFDTRPAETFGVQEILVDRFGKNISADGKMGPQTVAAINSVDAGNLYAEIKKERKRFYDWIVANDKTQQQWYNGWMNRLALFPDIVKGAAGAGLVLLFAAGIALFFLMPDERNS